MQMNAPALIYAVALTIVSLAVIFMILVIKPNKVTKEKLEKILKKEVIEKLKNAENEKEMKEIIRNLDNKTKMKLKTLFESQDIRDVINGVKEHFKV
jgi:uncharacterized membrane protein YhiD involved in acid resistance